MKCRANLKNWLVSGFSIITLLLTLLLGMTDGSVFVFCLVSIFISVITGVVVTKTVLDTVYKLTHKRSTENTISNSDITWIATILDALENDSFVLFYQPIVPITNLSAPIHREVLVRMIDESGKLISPETFIPVAERHNLMSSIDRWVIRNLFNLSNRY